jgi:hypothetical protein
MHIQLTVNDLKKDALSQICLKRRKVLDMRQSSGTGPTPGNYFVIGPKNVCYYGF